MSMNTTHEAANEVVAFDAIKRRNRLSQLVDTRRHLATMAAQQRSHGMEDAQESFMTQVTIESIIREEFPEEYENSYAEVEGEHPAVFLTAECGICCSIAEYSGVNLVPPDAA